MALNDVEYRSLTEKVLQRVGFFHSLWAEGEGPQRTSSTPNRSSERLRELQQRYDSFPCAARSHSQWSEVTSNAIDFERFRGESAYMWQYRDGNVPLTYLATYFYQKCSPDADLLRLCVEDESFGVYGIPADGGMITRDRLDSVTELGFLRQYFGLQQRARFSVLDIGSGYGRLAWRMSQCFPQVHMLCADAVAESAFLCEFYLRHRGAPRHLRMVPLPDLADTLAREPVEMAIAVNSLSECSAASIRWWIELLQDHAVPHFIMVSNSYHGGGSQLFSNEANPADSVPLLPMFAERRYRRVHLAPKYTEQALQMYGVSPTYFHVFERF